MASVTANSRCRTRSGATARCPLADLAQGHSRTGTRRTRSGCAWSARPCSSYRRSGTTRPTRGHLRSPSSASTSPTWPRVLRPAQPGLPARPVEPRPAERAGRLDRDRLGSPSSRCCYPPVRVADQWTTSNYTIVAGGWVALAACCPGCSAQELVHRPRHTVDEQPSPRRRTRRSVVNDHAGRVRSAVSHTRRERDRHRSCWRSPTCRGGCRASGSTPGTFVDGPRGGTRLQLPAGRPTWR